MSRQVLEQLKYPIGQFKCPEIITSYHLKSWIDVLEQFPSKLKDLVKHLDDKQLDTAYRPGGWTVRQVVHHVSDSHHHSYIRFKWALTEDKPIIKYYYEQLWAELPDAKYAPIQSFIHPEHNEEVVLKKNIGIYAWHSNHHYAHIENLLKREGWLS